MVESAIGPGSSHSVSGDLKSFYGWKIQFICNISNFIKIAYTLTDVYNIRSIGSKSIIIVLSISVIYCTYKLEEFVFRFYLISVPKWNIFSSTYSLHFVQTSYVVLDVRYKFKPNNENQVYVGIGIPNRIIFKKYTH